MCRQRMCFLCYASMFANLWCSVQEQEPGSSDRQRSGSNAANRNRLDDNHRRLIFSIPLAKH